MVTLLNCIIRFLKRAGGILSTLAHFVYGVLWTLAHGPRADLTEPLDKPVMVLGNGPSLNDIDLPAVTAAGIELACVNFFPSRNESFWTLRPAYLFLFDPDFHRPAEKRTPEVTQLWAALEKVTWPMRIVVPQGCKLPIENALLRPEMMTAFTYSSDYMVPLLDRLYRENLLIPGCQNVSVGAGCYFTSRRVPRLYYAGIDMSEFKQLFIDEQNRIYADTIHSYGTNREYRTDVAAGEFFRVLGGYQTMFAQFHHLAQYARRQGVSVTNLSVNSYVDVFPKSTQFHKVADNS